MSKKHADNMGAHPFSPYSSVPEDYRILKSQWKLVENVLNATGKFGPGVSEDGNETLGDYRTVEMDAKVGIGEEEVVILRTHDPEVKKLLSDLISKSKKSSLSKIDLMSMLPRLRQNAIKPLGEIEHYQEHETVMVAPMDAKTVREAFDYYNANYQDLNRFRKMDEQLPRILEKRHYTLEQIMRNGETHTLIVPSEDPQRRAEFDKAMNSGEIPLGNELYSLVYPLPREASAVDATDAGEDAGKRKEKRR